MVDPRDIRIVETTPGGARRPMSGPSLAEEETFWDENGEREGGQQGVASIGEDGAIDMTGVGEYQVGVCTLFLSLYTDLMIFCHLGLTEFFCKNKEK